MPAADEGRKVALYVFIGLATSFGIFATMRMFAKPGPSTMTKEYQEASNEFVKVRYPDSPQSIISGHPLILFAEPTRRAPYRYLSTRILRSRHGPIAAQALSCGHCCIYSYYSTNDDLSIDKTKIPLLFPLSLERSKLESKARRGVATVQCIKATEPEQLKRMGDLVWLSGNNKQRAAEERPRRRGRLGKNQRRRKDGVKGDQLYICTSGKSYIV